MKTLLVLAVLIVVQSSSSLAKTYQYDELYASGVQYYFDGDWSFCIRDLEESIKQYRYFNHALTECRQDCVDSSTNAQEYILQKAICDNSCEKKIFNGTTDTLRVFEEVDKAYKDRRPYTYLQYAYYKVGKLRQAAEACYTYTVHDPDDEAMADNMEFYKSHEDFKTDMLVDLEQVVMMESYNNAVKAYQAQQYAAAKKLFEIATTEYFKEEELCRNRCDRSYNTGKAYPDDIIRQHEHINEHFKQLLECSLLCVNEAASVNKKFAVTDLLPEMYHYLQFASYKLGHIELANKYAKSYLVIFPGDKVMTSNLGYYKVDTDVQPTNNVVKLKKRIDLQSGLLSYYYTTFGVKNFNPDILVPFKPKGLATEDKKAEVTDETAAASAKKPKPTGESAKPLGEAVDISETGNLGSYKTFQEKTDDIIESRDISHMRQEELKREKREADNKDFEERLKKLDEAIDGSTIGRRVIDSPLKVTISEASLMSERPTAEGPLPAAMSPHVSLLANSTQMGGDYRVAFDGLALQGQCQTLIDLELVGGTFGDGYYGNQSPHTQREKFQGLTLLDAIMLAEAGKVPMEAVKLFDEISQEALEITKSYFKLDSELYFDYTHLVCRTALKTEFDDGLPATDLSHPVHGDNCLLNVDGRCVKESPAYTWRDYSAIVYLNENFAGGQFIMTDNTARQVTHEVEPKCGRLVSFCAGADCLHGVRPVTRGRRCAVALWFTHDASHDERKRLRETLAFTKYYGNSRDEL